MDKHMLMIDIRGIQQIEHADGSFTFRDTETGITETFYGPDYEHHKPYACPHCGSYAIMTHHMGGIVAGDQDYERVCMDCGNSIL